MNIQDLPTEILENIFANFLPINGDGRYERILKIYELLYCTEVCKLFNEVIGQSERLMSGIKIRWNEREDPFLKTSRLYRNIQIGKISTASTRLFDFLKTQPKISLLRTGLLKLQAQEFWMIIDAIKNSLKELYIGDVELSGDPVLMPIYIPNLRKIEFWFGDMDKGMENICYLFNNSENVEELLFSTERSLNSDFSTKIEAFLIDCKRLKILNLYGTILDKIFETSNFAERASFPLEKLNFSWENVLNSQMLTNLNLFLKNQAFLKELKLENLLVTNTLLDTIFGIKTLKEFDLHDPEFQIVHNVLHIRSTSIETLKLKITGFEMDPEDDDIEWYTGICQIIKGCPAVRELKFSQVSFSDMVAQHVIEHLKKLETLTLDVEKKIHLVNVPTIRTLIFGRIDGSTYEEFDREQAINVLEFIQQNPQLTKIKIHKDYVYNESLNELSNIAQGRLEYISFLDRY